MPFDPHTDLASSTVQAGSTIIGSTAAGTTIILATGDGTKFPSGGAFYVTLAPASTDPALPGSEIVRVTRSTDTLTVATGGRGQGTTTALATIAAGWQVIAGLTSEYLTQLEKAAQIRTVEVDFGTSPVYTQVGGFTIIDADVTPTSLIMPNQSGVAATGKSADENEMDTLYLRAVPGTGQFTLYADAAPGPVTGKFKINYQVY